MRTTNHLKWQTRRTSRQREFLSRLRQILVAASLLPITIPARHRQTIASPRQAARNVQPYQEAREADGSARLAWQLYSDRAGRDILQPSVHTQRNLLEGHPLLDAEMICPRPLLLGATEGAWLPQGIRQRARTYIRVIRDLALEDASCVRAGVLPEAVLRVVLRDTVGTMGDLKALWVGKTVEDINFEYGADLIRGPHGRWMVIEDNLGPVGGLISPAYIQRAFLLASGLERHPPGYLDAEGDFPAMVEAFLRIHGLQRSQVLAAVPSGRLAYARPRSKFERGKDSFKAARAEEIFEQAGVSVHRVGQGEAAEEAAALQQVIEDRGIKGIVGRPHREILAELDHGNLQLWSNPATDFASHKALTPYIEALTKFFFDEDPLLSAQPSALYRLVHSDHAPYYALTPEVPIPFDLVARLPYSELVFKLGDSAQGTEVLVGRHMSQEKLEKNFALTAADLAVPSVVYDQFYTAQQYLRPSELEGWPIDIRFATCVFGGREIVVPRVPWGRALPPVGETDHPAAVQGLSNLSAGGSVHLPAIVEDPN